MRDLTVTGVQTCALPICSHGPHGKALAEGDLARGDRPRPGLCRVGRGSDRTGGWHGHGLSGAARGKIGRASCRGRVWVSVVAGSLKKIRGGPPAGLLDML